MTSIDQSIPADHPGIQLVKGRRITPEEIYQGSESFYQHFITVQERLLEYRYSQPAQGGARVIVNYDAMQDDPVYEQLQKTKEARTMFLAQQMTGDGAPLSGEPDESGAATQAAETEETSTAAQTFLEFMAKSPRERYYEMILKEKGLTKEQLDAMPPEERAKIEREIQEEIEHRVKLEAAKNA